jgi:hypothetical protein
MLRQLKFLVCQMKKSECLFIANFVLASSDVDRGLKSRSGETKDYRIGICCFSGKHAALRRERENIG